MVLNVYTGALTASPAFLSSAEVRPFDLAEESFVSLLSPATMLVVGRQSGNCRNRNCPLESYREATNQDMKVETLEGE